MEIVDSRKHEHILQTANLSPQFWKKSFTAYLLN